MVVNFLVHETKSESLDSWLNKVNFSSTAWLRFSRSLNCNWWLPLSLPYFIPLSFWYSTGSFPCLGGSCSALRAFVLFCLFIYPKASFLMRLAVNTPLMFCHSIPCKSVWRAEDVLSPEFLWLPLRLMQSPKTECVLFSRQCCVPKPVCKHILCLELGIVDIFTEGCYLNCLLSCHFH